VILQPLLVPDAVPQRAATSCAIASESTMKTKHLTGSPSRCSIRPTSSSSALTSKKLELPVLEGRQAVLAMPRHPLGSPRKRERETRSIRFSPRTRSRRRPERPQAPRAGPAGRAVRGWAGDGPASRQDGVGQACRPYLSVTAAATNFLRPALPGLVPWAAHQSGNVAGSI
jgi:hypothetical protein